VADTQLDNRGKKVEPVEADFGENVLIVSEEQPDDANRAQ
jgi:hypothetical protein